MFLSQTPVNLQFQYAPKMVRRHSVHVLISPCYLNTLFSGLFDSQLAIPRVCSACCQCPEVWQPATHALYVIKSSDTQVSTAIHSQTLNQQQRDPTPKVTKIPNTWPVIPKSYLVLPSFHLQISDLHIIHDLQSLFVHSSFCHSTDNAAKADAVGLLLFALVFCRSKWVKLYQYLEDHDS